MGTYNGHNGAVPTCDVSSRVLDTKMVPACYALLHACLLTASFHSAVDSSRLLTASADSSAKLWDVATGECLFTFNFTEPCKATAFALGDSMAAISTDPFMQRSVHTCASCLPDLQLQEQSDSADLINCRPPAIHLVDIAEETSDQTDDILQSLEGFKTRINRVVFTDLNKTLLSAGEDGFVRRWDLEVRPMPVLSTLNLKP